MGRSTTAWPAALNMEGYAHAAPLIVTLELDAKTREAFDLLRRTYFPVERNHLSAHLTLFHHLPGDEEQAVIANLAEVCVETDVCALRVASPFLMGRGVAYRVEGAALLAVHAQLVSRWRPWLTEQDSQPLRPHVTVQNKVEPAVARTSFDELRAGFTPFVATGEGLHLWRYRGGPWESVGLYRFRPPKNSA